MMRMKKITAALLALALMLTMLSCITVAASAESELSGPVSVEKVRVGLDVSGTDLPGNCLVVSSAWGGLDVGTQVNVKLDGKLYKAYFGGNAFAEINDAVANAVTGTNVYVTAGNYAQNIHIRANNLSIYGPYAGISPNAVTDATDAIDLKDPNPARPAAANTADNQDEAVVSGNFIIYKPSGNLVIDGIFFSGTSQVSISGDSDQGGVVRYGTRVRNCIANVSSAYLLNIGRGYNLDFLVENNRVLKGVGISNVAGFGDVTLRSNYFNNTGKAVYTHSLSGATMGLPVLIENNYWENSGTIYSFAPTDLNYPSSYTVSVKGNYVENFAGGYIVENMYLALKSVPGINIHVTGNTFKGIKSTPFYFPYTASPSASTMARFLVNINENYFEMGKAVTFIDSQMNATLNCARNYYTSPISVDRVVKYKDSTLILYPYYSDPEMTTLVGGASISAINLDAERFGVVLDQENKEVVIDFRGEGMDSVDLSSIISVDEGCSWKMYKTATLAEEVKGSVVYFDGIETIRYVAVTGADGVSTTVYRLYMTNDLGSKAELIDVEFDTAAVPEPEVTGTHYVYNLNSETAVLNYDLHVSNGATYTLWLDSLCQAKPLTDTMGGYIPYTEEGEDGYTVYVKIESEDGNATGKYTLEFVRPRSANYDPGVLGVVAPETNAVVRTARKTIYYYCTGIQSTETFDFTLTPDASYTIYNDRDHTRALSSGSDIKALSLLEGQNIFYVEIKDAKGTNEYLLIVENGTRSSDNTIASVSGANTSSVTGDKINIATGIGDSVTVNFVTNNPYATVTVYADEQRVLPISYTSDPVTENGRTIDDRTFELETKQSTGKYYIVCRAENGSTRAYTLIIEKTFYANTFTDVVAGAWYANAVNAVAALGVMNGSKVGEDQETGTELFAFRPNAKITRQEVAVVVAAMKAHNPGAYASVALNFADKSSIASWAAPSVKVCNFYGYMQGVSGNRFAPTANITRQELMVLLARAYGLTGTTDLSTFADGNQVADWASAGVQACVKAGIVVGSNNKLNPTGTITRAEVATMISQIDAKIGLYN